MAQEQWNQEKHWTFWVSYMELVTTVLHDQCHSHCSNKQLSSSCNRTSATIFHVNLGLLMTEQFFLHLFQKRTFENKSVGHRREGTKRAGHVVCCCCWVILRSDRQTGGQKSNALHLFIGTCSYNDVIITSLHDDYFTDCIKIVLLAVDLVTQLSTLRK